MPKRIFLLRVVVSNYDSASKEVHGIYEVFEMLSSCVKGGKNVMKWEAPGFCNNTEVKVLQGLIGKVPW